SPPDRIQRRSEPNNQPLSVLVRPPARGLPQNSARLAKCRSFWYEPRHPEAPGVSAMHGARTSAASLTGIWQGIYSYDDGREDAPFVATLLDLGGAISG